MDPHYIPGIFNYCDRWCERCSFNHRCEIFAEEQKMSEEQRDPDNPAFWDYINDNFRKVMGMVETWAEEEGIDMHALQEEAAGQPKRRELPPGRKALEDLSRDYTLRTLDWLKAHREAFLEREAELNKQLQLGIDVRQEGLQLADAIEVVQWYCTMASAKTHRALRAYDDKDEWYWDSPLQSDANGTAKVALLCIERSLGAWEGIRRLLPEKADEIIDMLVLLSQIRRGLQEYFPDSDKFIRPGFDEVDAG